MSSTPPTIPSEIDLQIRDDIQGLTYSVDSITCVYKDDPVPLGTDDNGTLTIVVDMSEDGAAPTGVHSLSSSFMVSEYQWMEAAAAAETISENDTPSYSSLVVNGVSLEGKSSNNSRHLATTDSGVKQQGLFATIKQDSDHLSQRVAALVLLVKDDKEPSPPSRS